MSTPETSTERPSRWGAFTKGAFGAVVLAVGGYLGAAMMQVISAPKDSVAYDLIQSMTGMLKPPPDKPASEPRAAAASQPAPPAEQKLASAAQKAAAPTGLSPQPPSASPPPAPSAPPAAAPSTPASPSATANSSSSPPPAGSMLDRVRKTTELAGQAQNAVAALGASRVLSLADRAKTPICGADYEIEVSSVAPGAGAVALRRSGGSAAPVTLAVGQPPQNLGAGCRIVLLSTMEDLTNRRAQLREIAAK